METSATSRDPCSLWGLIVGLEGGNMGDVSPRSIRIIFFVHRQVPTYIVRDATDQTRWKAAVFSLKTCTNINNLPVPASWMRRSRQLVDRLPAIIILCTIAMSGNFCGYKWSNLTRVYNITSYALYLIIQPATTVLCQLAEIFPRNMFHYGTVRIFRTWINEPLTMNTPW